MIRIKGFCDWASAEELYTGLIRMTPKQKGKWGNLRLVLNDDYDYAIVYNFVKRPYKINTSKAIIFQCEPRIVRKAYWGGNNPNYKEYFVNYDVDTYHTVQPDWLIELTYDELKKRKIKKTRVMSGLVSSKRGFEGQKDRVAFLRCLDKLGYYDHYGSGGNGLKCHKGNTPITKRFDLIAPYKYNFAAENCYQENYFTEKILSSVLLECFTFYSGCPNISDFIDSRCYHPVNLKNPRQAIDDIKTLVETNIWEDRIEIIKEEKKRIMKDYHSLEIVRRILNKEL